jgi:hypothetical protein
MLPCDLTTDACSQRGQMLKIQRTSNGDAVFVLSGQMGEEHIAELEKPIASETGEHGIVLDLKDVILAGQEAISFVERYEPDGVTLLYCAGYIREWIRRTRWNR